MFGVRLRPEPLAVALAAQEFGVPLVVWRACIGRVAAAAASALCLSLRPKPRLVSWWECMLASPDQPAPLVPLPVSTPAAEQLLGTPIQGS
jgi:hypothetical protein